MAVKFRTGPRTTISTKVVDGKRTFVNTKFPGQTFNSAKSAQGGNPLIGQSNPFFKKDIPGITRAPSQTQISTQDPVQAPPPLPPPSLPEGTLKQGLDRSQRESITNLVSSNRAFNDEDARNFAFATGSGDHTQFIGKTGREVVGQLSPGEDPSAETPASDALSFLGESPDVDAQTGEDVPVPTDVQTNLKDLGIADTPSESEIAQSVIDSPEFSFLQERFKLESLNAESKAEATKDFLEKKFQSDKTDLENVLARKGLAFSGIRATQVRALAADLAASELQTDRELASKVLDLDLDVREAIFDLVGDAVKSAQAGQKEAIAQLNKAGFAVVGNTLVPTVAAQSAESLAQNRAFTQSVNLARLDLSQAQFEFDQAKNDVTIAQAQRRIEISEAQLNLAIAREGRLAAGGDGVDTIVDPTKSQLATASANFLTANPDQTLDDWADLSDTDKIRWLGTKGDTPEDIKEGLLCGRNRNG